MIKFFPFAAALAATLAPVAAYAEAPSTVFEYEGERYVYTSKQENGRTFIRGYAEKGYEPFDLTVRNGRVSGTVNGRSVAFRVAEAKRLDEAKIAAR